MRLATQAEAQQLALTGTAATTPSPVLYAGPQRELAGLDQVNLALPRRLVSAGEVRVSVNEIGALVPLLAIK
jgi:uncharacterized protein (TIGR03437 family)